MEKFQLPCGGQLHIVIEPFSFDDKRCGGSGGSGGGGKEGESDSRLEKLTQAVARLEARQCVERRLDLASGDFSVTDVDRFRHLQFDGDLDDLDTAGKQLTQVYGPRFQLFLIGAGHVSQCLAQMALMLDYHLIVCDPREEMIEQVARAGRAACEHDAG